MKIKTLLCAQKRISSLCCHCWWCYCSCYCAFFFSQIGERSKHPTIVVNMTLGFALFSVFTSSVFLFRVYASIQRKMCSRQRNFCVATSKNLFQEKKRKSISWRSNTFPHTARQRGSIGIGLKNSFSTRFSDYSRNKHELDVVQLLFVCFTL